MQTALVTGADRGLGLAMSAELVGRGWRVFASSYLVDWPELRELASRHPDSITLVPLDIGSDSSVRQAVDFVRERVDQVDLVINNAAVISFEKDVPIRGKQDYEDMMRVYNVNALGALRVVDAVLPLMARSALKRLCFVSSEAGCVERASRESWFGYMMSKRALNMGVGLLFDSLRPQGFSFRLYHPGWVRTYMSGKKNMDAELEPEEVAAVAIPYFTEPLADVDDEDRLVMRDWQGSEWPW